MPAASLEEVLATVARLEARVLELEAEAARVPALQVRVAELQGENAELRRRLGMDSGNSSKPPSTDGPDKAPPKSLRKKTGRKSGGQPGRAGGRLEQVTDPDQTVVHRPAVCGGCAGELGADARVAGSPVVRQVFDLPEVAVEVTEHRMLAVACGCGHTTRAEAPDRVQGPTNIGDGLAAVAVYLSTAQMIPIERIAETIEALYGISVSTGWVSLALGRAKEAVEPATEAIKKRIVGFLRGTAGEGLGVLLNADEGERRDAIVESLDLSASENGRRNWEIALPLPATEARFYACAALDDIETIKGSAVSVLLNG
jgi:transposase